MELLTPASGLIVWTSIAFLLLIFLLKKFAWGPILSAVEEREHTIRQSLESAEKARQELLNLKADNEKLLQEAREERSIIIKQAREAGDKIIVEAREKASAEFSQKVEEARREIDAQKEAAKAELKTQLGQLSVALAEKILERELSAPDAQKAYTQQLIDQIKLN